VGAPVFVAYPYKLDPDYRAMLLRVESQAFLNLLLPEDDPSTTHLDEKVLTILRSAVYAIFDFTEWNPNVAFEFGMAIAMVSTLPAPKGTRRRQRLALFAKKDTDRLVPSDLGGMGVNVYESLGDLEEKLTKLLSERFPPIEAFEP
jgi:hypothetical protein